MSWIQVKANFADDCADLSPFVDIFREFGIENTLEEGASLTGCLVSVEGAAQRSSDLADALRSAGACSVSVEPLEEQNWEIAWRQFFKPRRVGQRFVVVPTWENFDALEGDLILLLDPGQAFGTGDHPTTRMCLELMEDLELNGAHLADIGCGSGILAIAAAKLGAEVDAFDIDPIAVEVTKENMIRNGVTLTASCRDAFQDPPESLANVPQDETPLPKSEGSDAANEMDPKYDVVLSNIISATLRRISRQVAAAVKPGGAWIVSGIIESNWEAVLESAQHSGFDLIKETREDGWVAARFRRLTFGD